jgi:hypothetical protein
MKSGSFLQRGPREQAASLQGGLFAFQATLFFLNQANIFPQAASASALP